MHLCSSSFHVDSMNMYEKEFRVLSLTLCFIVVLEGIEHHFELFFERLLLFLYLPSVLIEWNISSPAPLIFASMFYFLVGCHFLMIFFSVNLFRFVLLSFSSLLVSFFFLGGGLLIIGIVVDIRIVSGKESVDPFLCLYLFIFKKKIVFDVRSLHDFHRCGNVVSPCHERQSMLNFLFSLFCVTFFLYDCFCFSSSNSVSFLLVVGYDERVDKGDYMTRYSRDELPACPGKGSCPFAPHPLAGEEWCIGCAMCLREAQRL